MNNVHPKDLAEMSVLKDLIDHLKATFLDHGDDAHPLDGMGHPDVEVIKLDAEPVDPAHDLGSADDLGPVDHAQDASLDPDVDQDVDSDPALNNDSSDDEIDLKKLFRMK